MTSLNAPPVHDAPATSHQHEPRARAGPKLPPIAETPLPSPPGRSTSLIYHRTVLSLVRVVEKLRTLSSLPRVTGPPSVTCIPQTSPCAVLAFIPVSCVTSPPDYTERTVPSTRSASSGAFSSRRTPSNFFESFIRLRSSRVIDVCEPSAESRHPRVRGGVRFYRKSAHEG